MGYKFDKNRHITKSVAEKIPTELQLFMFNSLNTMKAKSTGELDYLQVFKIRIIEMNGNYITSVHHEQEIPECHIDYMFIFDEVINLNVYIIDDVEYVTMLLSDEY